MEVSGESFIDVPVAEQSFAKALTGKNAQEGMESSVSKEAISLVYRRSEEVIVSTSCTDRWCLLAMLNVLVVLCPLSSVVLVDLEIMMGRQKRDRGLITW